MESINKLFAVYLGGKADRCNIELHDVVFVAGSSIEATYPLLKKKWFGDPNRVHIDAYIALEIVDGYSISLTKEKCPGNQKLYFLNFGAYKPGVFAEFHENGFYVAETAADAIRKAKKELCKGLTAIHKDDLVEIDVDDIIELEEVDQFFISFAPSQEPPSQSVSAYKLMK